jgi:hypothetical protein
MRRTWHRDALIILSTFLLTFIGSVVAGKYGGGVAIIAWLVGWFTGITNPDR